jgi:hypothetical protein
VFLNLLQQIAVDAVRLANLIGGEVELGLN